MSEATKNKVYTAVRTCLNECYGAADPLVRASAFIDRLRADPGWGDGEVAEVEGMVLRAVRVIVRQPRDACCHNTRA